MAVKKIERVRSDHQAKEANLLSNLNCPTVIELIGYSYDEKYMYIVMPLLHGNLVDYFSQIKQSSDRLKLIRKFALDIARGLDAMHSRKGNEGEITPIVHRDIKAANILLTDSVLDNASAVIADFSVSRYCIDAHKGAGTDTGSATYKAREVGKHQYGTSADIYSYGVLLITMLHGEEFQTADDITKAIANLPSHFKSLV